MVWKNDQVSEKETARILELAKLCLEVEGDYVEMGCYKGDTSLLLADILFSGSHCSRPAISHRLYIYDSFEGLPEKGKQDESALGASFKTGELGVTKREVKLRFLKAGLPVPVIKKAWFKDLTESDLPEKIAFSFIDGDFYESIRDSLKLVVPKMAHSGVLIIHDYTNPALPGVSKAVDEFVGGKIFDFEIVLL